MSNENLSATDLHGFSPIKTNQNKIKIFDTEGTEEHGVNLIGR